MNKAKRILLAVLLVTAAAAVVYAVLGVISILRSSFTSFPWWSALAFAALYFGPVLAVEAVALIIVSVKAKKQA